MKPRATLASFGAGRFYVVVVLVMVILGLAHNSAAQDKPADNMQILLEKIKADKKLLVAENMQLTDSEGKAFWPLYERYQDELFLLRVRTAKLVKDYADTNENMTDATANRLINEYIKIETLRLKLHKAYLPKFRKVLSGAKVMPLSRPGRGAFLFSAT